MPEPPAPPPAPDLAAIEARAAAATPEPWEWGLDPVIEPGYHTQACVYIGTHPRHRDATIIAEVDYDRQVDADFIANARTDVPALVAYARALEAANARLAQEADALLRALRDAPMPAVILEVGYWEEYRTLRAHVRALLERP